MGRPIQQITIVGGGTAGWLAAARIAESREALASAEKAAASARKGALTTLAANLEKDAEAAGDAPKVRMLIEAVQELGSSVVR